MFVLGNEKVLNEFSISIVGTRNSSEEGNHIAYQISKNLASNNIVIVSGLASGIDTASHQGAIDTGKTIAIIASGFNYISSKNFTLLNQILTSGGAIISEHFPDVPPQPFSFLKRNRLIASISKALIVIEAPEKSGALNTAKTAIKLNRPIFVTPWNITSFRGVGSNKLLENGANILTDYTQILKYFSFPTLDLKSKFNDKKDNNHNSNSKINLSNSKTVLGITNTKSNTYQIPNKTNKNLVVSNLISIPIEFKPLYQYIQKNAPVSSEQIYSHFIKESIPILNSKLTLMELKNLIAKRGDKYFIN